MNIILGPTVFPEEDKAICKGKYMQYTSKSAATEACQKDDTCDGITGVSKVSTSNACHDLHTVFQLCKRLDVFVLQNVGNSQSNCNLKKRFGKIIVYNVRFEIV